MQRKNPKGFNNELIIIKKPVEIRRCDSNFKDPFAQSHTIID